jgi:hypothetical protein
MTPLPNIRTRNRSRIRRAALGLTLLVVTPAILAGCDPRQALYFFQPFDPKIAAPCPTMKGKKVVVLAVAAPGTQNEYVSIDREIGNELVKKLRTGVKHIELVDQEKVRDWLKSKPSMSDPADAARAFDADIVVFIEVQKFQVQSPIDLAMYQGKAIVHVQVTELVYPKDDRDRDLKDKPKESKIVFEDDRDIEFPVTGGIPIESGTSKATFKNRFMKIVHEQISWSFLDHAPGDNIQDTRFHE